MITPFLVRRVYFFFLSNSDAFHFISCSYSSGFLFILFGFFLDCTHLRKGVRKGAETYKGAGLVGWLVSFKSLPPSLRLAIFGTLQKEQLCHCILAPPSNFIFSAHWKTCFATLLNSALSYTKEMLA